MTRSLPLLMLVWCSPVWGFAVFGQQTKASPYCTTRSMAAVPSQELVDPTERDNHYKGNVAQYLVDLHDSKTTFDFCGGMMFQLVLSEKLRDHLLVVAKEGENSNKQPVVFDATQSRMHQIPGYSQTANADNVQVFHGREIRQVPDAAGGMGFVLQLSLANDNDVEGWTEAEVEGYDGWGHDSGRVWRKGDQLENEGFTSFRERFGPSAFALHHRFYLHLDRGNRIWLSAEDGCEGTPAQTGASKSAFASISNIFGMS